MCSSIRTKCARRSLHLSAPDFAGFVPVWWMEVRFAKVWMLEVWVAETMGHLGSRAAWDRLVLLVPSARQSEGRRRSWVGYVTFVPLPQAWTAEILEGVHCWGRAH